MRYEVMSNIIHFSSIVIHVYALPLSILTLSDALFYFKFT